MHTIAAPLHLKEPRQPRRRYLCRDGFGIQTIPRRGDGVGIDVGGKHLQLHRHAGAGDLLLKQHGKGISLLPRAAPGHPDPQLRCCITATDQSGDGGLRQLVKHFAIPEKLRDMDQQILRQQLHLAGRAAQPLQIRLHRPHRQPHQPDAPLDPPLQGAGLVEAEIMGAGGAQQSDNLLQRRSNRAARRGHRRPGGQDPARQIIVKGAKRARHLGNRQHGPHTACGNRRCGHAGIFRLLRPLRDRGTAMLADRHQTQAAIRPGAGQHHPHGAFAIFLRQGAQQKIKGQSRPVCCFRCAEMQRAILHG